MIDDVSNNNASNYLKLSCLDIILFFLPKEKNVAEKFYVPQSFQANKNSMPAIKFFNYVVFRLINADNYLKIIRAAWKKEKFDDLKPRSKNMALQRYLLCTYFQHISKQFIEGSTTKIHVSSDELCLQEQTITSIHWNWNNLTINNVEAEISSLGGNNKAGYLKVRDRVLGYIKQIGNNDNSLLIEECFRAAVWSIIVTVAPLLEDLEKGGNAKEWQKFIEEISQ